MLASNFSGFGVMVPEQPLQPVIIETIEVSPREDKKVLINRNAKVEEYVRNYFSDIPILVEVAKCESRFRQYNNESGGVLRGEINSLDRGVMQINEYYHNEDSEKLGFNILTLEGNAAYARYLYEKYGVKPWNSSSKCWSKTTAYSEYKTDELAMK